MRTHREMMLSILAPYGSEDDLVRWSSAAKEGNDGSKAQIAWLIMQSTHLWERTKLFWARKQVEPQRGGDVDE